MSISTFWNIARAYLLWFLLCAKWMSLDGKVPCLHERCLHPGPRMKLLTRSKIVTNPQCFWRGKKGQIHIRALFLPKEVGQILLTFLRDEARWTWRMWAQGRRCQTWQDHTGSARGTSWAWPPCGWAPGWWDSCPAAQRQTQRAPWSPPPRTWTCPHSTSGLQKKSFESTCLKCLTCQTCSCKGAAAINLHHFLDQKPLLQCWKNFFFELIPLLYQRYFPQQLYIWKMDAAYTAILGLRQVEATL